MLRRTPQSVNSYMRYPRGPRAEWPDTINAQYIRAYRERQLEKMKKAPQKSPDDPKR